MDRTTTFEQFLATQSAQIPTGLFVVNLCIAAVLAAVLAKIYVHYGDALSNRRAFARNFILITTTTMLIISIVKSSLALSLGLVGALSIIRFRAAIKEPEELAYLFLAIALGLGLGADQTKITLVAFTLIALIVIAVKSWGGRSTDRENLYLTVDNAGGPKISLNDISTILEQHCSRVDLRRFEENADDIEATFLVEFESYDALQNAKEELHTRQGSLNILFLDGGGIAG